jgi:hypothetical protein
MSGQQYFTSRKNYLKRQPISGSAPVSAPSTLASWFNYYSTYTVNHALGYAPMVRVSYEPDASNGKVYPATGRRLAGLGPGLSYGDVMCLWEVDENNLTIYLESVSSKTGTRNVYWVMYLDSE